MIVYFADRQFNILGQASTGLPQGLIVVDDNKAEEIETGIASFECKLHFDDATRAKAKAFTAPGNYILRSDGKESELFSITDRETNTKKQEIYIYAEDDGLDLLNEVVGAYEADQPYAIDHYINKYAAGAGFVIGINEAEGLTKQLVWDSEETASARIANIAAQFDGCEVSFSFKVTGLRVVKKYINIYRERGKDNGIQLRLDKEIDSIITTESIANLATALQVTGGTPDDSDEPITLLGYEYDDGDFYVDGSVLKSRTAFKKWSRLILGNQEGGHITKPFTSKATSQAVLCEEAIAELKRYRDMEVNYEADITKFPDNVRIGDRVSIIDDADELYVSARILKLETSVVNQEHKVTLGEYLIKTSGIRQKVIELAEQFAKQTVSVKNAQKIATSAKKTAEAAQTQAEAAAKEATAAQTKADAAKVTADKAAQSAENAQAKALAAEAAVNKVEQSVTAIETSVTEAREAIDNAQSAADTATAKAEEAETAANNAQAKAEAAETAAGKAQASAESAVTKADTAIDTANTAKTAAEEASTTALAAKADAEQAGKDIQNWADDLETYKQTVSAEYSRKTELTEATTSLQSQITTNANELGILHSQVTSIDETANNAAEQAQNAQANAALAQQQAEQATADAEAAQTAANNAAAAATAAQNEADTAKAAAATAQDVADTAKANLEAAQETLATVQSRVDATEADIAAAEKAVENAQSAADKAQADANAAATKANNAQSVADAAVSSAEAAQTAADNAADKANIAQQAADEAKGNAAKAQATADEASQKAATAQATADTAKSNADNAQATADAAAATAAAAQKAADDADARAAQAAADLATAKQNLANVTSRVDVTEEEIAAAQAAVETAQAAADKAKQDAATAQSTADTAKANADAAQAAADDAKTAADNAQKAAEEAQAAADQAQADVNTLAVRVTSAETNITKNSELIALTATRDEVAQTLGGYYTKDQTDAAITAKANEINLSVDSKVQGVQVGGRNLLKNSRHITLMSNNTALYPVSYSSKTENGREFRRYIRTETTLSPTTMSLYSAIPVTEITDVLTGQEITFSFLIRCSHSTTTNTMNVLVIDGTSQSFGTTETHNIGSEWQRVSLTATITAEYDYINSNLLRFNPLMILIPTGTIDTFYVDVCEWKIEKGNKATDWSPAPEDIDDKFSNYSTTEEMHSAIDLKAEGIFSTVKSTYTSKEDFANLDVGGRNFVRDSSLKEKTNLWAFDTNNTYSFLNGYCEVYRDTANGSRTFNNQSTNSNKLLKPDDLAGGTFTLSAEIKLLDGYSITDGSTLFYRCNTTHLSSGFQEISIKLGGATTEWRKVYSTFTFGEYNFDGSCQVCIALENAGSRGICIRNIKLEKGNKATDWTPAPEDTATDVDNLQETVNNYAGYEERITAAETSITQLADSISMLVQKADKSSRMEFDEESATWSFNTGEMDEKIITNTDDIAGLKDAANSTNSNVGKLQNKLDAWEEHVSITTYEDEPCLLLYEEDSNYKQYVTNTRRIITETSGGSETVKSEVGIDTATYENVVAKEKSQVGGFAWKKRGTNRICLVWEGE